MRMPLNYQTSRIALILLLVAAFPAALGTGDEARAAVRGEAKLSAAISGRLDRLISEGKIHEPLPLIVQTWGSPDPEEMDLVANLGGRVDDPFRSIHGFSARVPARNVMELAMSPRVKRLSFDWPVRAHLNTAIVSTGAVRAWVSEEGDSGYAGRGVTVALLDSGVIPAADFGPDAASILTEVDIVEPDDHLRDPFGHGTHLAGIIAGNAWSATADVEETGRPGFYGLAPGARILSVKVLDHKGRGRTSDVLAGVDWVLSNHEAYGIRVLLLPLGHPVDESYETDPLCQALEMAWEAGIAVIVSAGNDGASGYASITSPGNDPRVITVGASEDWDTPEITDDLVASFSSRGPTAFDGIIKPDLIAPGSRILSTRAPGSRIDRIQRAGLSDEEAERSFGARQMALSGTSMAAAMVAGAAAILLEQEPAASPDDIKARLMIGAEKLNDTIVARGAGLLSIPGALRLGDYGIVAQTAASPQVLIAEDADGDLSVQIQEAGSEWGEPFTWISTGVWGETSLWGVTRAWASPAAWEETDRWSVQEDSTESEIALWAGSVQIEMNEPTEFD